MFVQRFDLRLRDQARAADVYAAAVDMAEWGEDNGCGAVVISEHHASPDGYLPSPMLLAAAIASRTSSVPISIAALLLLFQDTVGLAEDMAVLHRLSRGRVSYVLGLGYRREEYELHGVAWERRGEQFERALADLLDALRSETITPFEPGVVSLLSCGGSSLAMARRAGRLGLGLLAQTSDPALEDAYNQAAAEAGVQPGLVILPPPELPYALFVADDIDEAWDELGPYLLHDATMYAGWNPGDETTASLSTATNVDDLRASNASHRIVDTATAVELLENTGFLGLHPLCGGLPPEVAWPYLRRVASDVLPAASLR